MFQKGQKGIKCILFVVTYVQVIDMSCEHVCTRFSLYIVGEIKQRFNRTLQILVYLGI